MATGAPGLGGPELSWLALQVWTPAGLPGHLDVAPELQRGQRAPQTGLGEEVATRLTVQQPARRHRPPMKRVWGAEGVRLGALYLFLVLQGTRGAATWSQARALRPEVWPYPALTRSDGDPISCQLWGSAPGAEGEELPCLDAAIGRADSAPAPCGVLAPLCSQPGGRPHHPRKGNPSLAPVSAARSRPGWRWPAQR